MGHVVRVHEFISCMSYACVQALGICTNFLCQSIKKQNLREYILNEGNAILDSRLA